MTKELLCDPPRPPLTPGQLAEVEFRTLQREWNHASETEEEDACEDEWTLDWEILEQDND